MASSESSTSASTTSSFRTAASSSSSYRTAAASLLSLFNNGNSSTSTTQSQSQLYHTAQSTLTDEARLSAPRPNVNANTSDEVSDCSTIRPDSSHVAVATRNTSLGVNVTTATAAAAAAAPAQIRPDTPAGHKKYLTQLVEVITAMGRKDGFNNRTHDGNKIAYETFYDGKKLVAEVVQRVIVMLLVNFGFMSRDKTRHGRLKEDWQPMEGTYFAVAGVDPPRTEFTVDGLHNKILKIFCRNLDSAKRYYDASVLLIPELNLKKTRTALSYFMQFCMNASDLAEMSIDMRNEMSIVRRKNKKKVLKKRKANDALRREIEKEKEIMAQLQAEIEVELKKQKELQQQSTEASARAQVMNLSEEEIDASIKQIRKELETLEGEIRKLKHLPEPPKATAAVASSSTTTGTQTLITKGISYAGNVGAPNLKPKATATSSKDERCQNPGCRCHKRYH